MPDINRDPGLLARIFLIVPHFTLYKEEGYRKQGGGDKEASGWIGGHSPKEKKRSETEV